MALEYLAVQRDPDWLEVCDVDPEIGELLEHIL